MIQRIPRLARAHVPAGCAIVRVERMSPAFVKYHLDDGRALHRFTRPEPTAHPHDHPWPFRTRILAGSYVEEVFTVLPDGSWTMTPAERVTGATYEIAATHIHRIVALPAGECWTLVHAGPHERTTFFWRFGDLVERRPWNRRRWSVHRPVRRMARPL
ncbi:hypothetical protein [uncultured Sphingomonas sp.]|uniref:hypothetical protein n=1 Tax=uncultured Sphingomonas sp. TaxID=158754 RepID=UPI0035CAF897